MIITDYIKKPSHAASMLNIDQSRLYYLLKNSDYRTFYIQKKNGEKRKIMSPSNELKRVQRRLAKILAKKYSLLKPDVVHGFIGKSKESKPTIISNAKPHINKKYVLNIDIKDFFATINFDRVVQCFELPPFSYANNLATMLAMICCDNNSLPMGAPTSPILTNFIFLELDDKIEKWSIKNDIVYTRYADDLTFSSNKDSFKDKALTEYLGEIALILFEENFQINKDKVKFRTSKQKQVVTGIIVNQKLNVDKKYRRHVRAMLHDYKINGLEKAAKNYYSRWLPNEKVNAVKFLDILRGKMAFVEQVKTY